MALNDNILEVMRGEHVAAVATVTDGRLAVRFMALVGLDDLSLIGGTMKTVQKDRADKEESRCSTFHLVRQELRRSLFDNSEQG
ncbi:MAG: hypothetical protein ABR985_20910 [Methanotrichaceae archaeon]|jgi:hypothetical protein